MTKKIFAALLTALCLMLSAFAYADALPPMSLTSLLPESLHEFADSTGVTFGTAETGEATLTVSAGEYIKMMGAEKWSVTFKFTDGAWVLASVFSSQNEEIATAELTADGLWHVEVQELRAKEPFFAEDKPADFLPCDLAAFDANLIRDAVHGRIPMLLDGDMLP